MTAHCGQKSTLRRWAEAEQADTCSADLNVKELWHVSDQDNIARFYPRLPANQESGISEAVVWAVDDAHLPNYLLPRDCPRICLRVAPSTSQADRAMFFGSCSASAVIIIEERWYERALQSSLWLYEMPPVSFRVVDSNAGYFVSTEAVDPVSVTEVRQPLELMKGRGTELRCVPRLRQLASQVARSTLAFSIIRLRNAAADDLSSHCKVVSQDAGGLWTGCKGSV